MNDFLEFVRKKLKKNIKIESILVIDNSDLHKNHKFFDSKKYHLKLEIKSKYCASDLGTITFKVATRSPFKIGALRLLIGIILVSTALTLAFDTVIVMFSKEVKGIVF